MSWISLEICNAMNLHSIWYKGLPRSHLFFSQPWTRTVNIIFFFSVLHLFDCFPSSQWKVEIGTIVCRVREENVKYIILRGVKINKFRLFTVPNSVLTIHCNVTFLTGILIINTTVLYCMYLLELLLHCLGNWKIVTSNFL